MKKFLLPLLIILIIISTILFNYVRYNQLNNQLNELGITIYEENNYIVRFKTINEMKQDVEEIIITYQAEITSEKEALVVYVESFNNSDFAGYIDQINEVDASVDSKIAYESALEELGSIESAVKNDVSKNSMQYFINDVNEYLVTNFTAEELASISVGIINLETKEEAYFNEEFLFYSASTIKVPINMYIYDLINAGVLSLNDTIVYTSEYYEGGTGVMQNDPYGSVYTLDYVLTQSIVTSDNVATNMLIFNYFDNPSDLTNDLEKYWGYCNLDYNTSRECSVTNHINSLNYLYDHSAEYELLIEDMKDSVYKDMVPKYIDVEVANKVGMDADIVIDDAIVYTTQPYAISIAFVGIEDAEERMAKLSEYIYNSWNKYFY